MLFWTSHQAETESELTTYRGAFVKAQKNATVDRVGRQLQSIASAEASIAAQLQVRPTRHLVSAHLPDATLSLDLHSLSFSGDGCLRDCQRLPHQVRR